MECLDSERRSSAAASFKGQETAVPGGESPRHRSVRVLVHVSPLLHPFFSSKTSFSIYAQAVKARTVSFVVSHPGEREPGSAGTSGSCSPAALHDGITPTCPQRIDETLQKRWV